MGGKKKQSLKQMQKAQAKTKKSKKAKRTATASSEKKAIPGITTPKLSDKFKNELKKMKVITPYAIASRFDLRLSTARSFLHDLERKGMIQFVSRSRNLVIYKPAD
jgi:small subunit ribosomal protein S25e